MSELRTEVDTWVRENRPKTMDVGSAPAWFTTLGERGYTVAHWPREHGGLGYTEEQSAVVRSVLTEHGVGLPDHYFVPLTLIGPAIIGLGHRRAAAALPARHRPPAPTCGASCSASPAPDRIWPAWRPARCPCGNGWRVNGQKVWSSFAAESRYGMLLARTDPDKPKNAGITCFLVDMSRTGRDGAAACASSPASEHFCEVFLQDVLLGPESVLGPVDDGWRVAMSTLNAERSGLSETTSASGVPLGPMLDRARRSGTWTDPVIRDRMADLIAVERALTLTNQRASGRVDHQTGALRALPADRRVGLRTRRGSGRLLGLTTVPPETHDLLDSRRFTIAGGTSEVQRNIVGEKVLGLDREIDPAAASRGANCDGVEMPTVTVRPSGITFEASTGSDGDGRRAGCRSALADSVWRTR